MKQLKKEKINIKKIILAIIAVLIALLLLISLFAGNYLVNYSIGRSGDGGRGDELGAADVRAGLAG